MSTFQEQAVGYALYSEVRVPRLLINFTTLGKKLAVHFILILPCVLWDKILVVVIVE